MFLRVPIYVTKCWFVNENPTNHKICQIAIRRPASMAEALACKHVGTLRLRIIHRHLPLEDWPLAYGVSVMDTGEQFVLNAVSIF